MLVERLVQYTVSSAEEGVRLDVFLAQQGLDQSRSQLKQLIDDGMALVNEQPARRVAQRLKAGDTVRLTIPPPVPSEVVAEKLPLEILFEDEQLIVVNKPAGMVVHPAPGHARGTLVGALLGHCEKLSGIGGVLRPGIVHRLDKLTSGVMVASKTDVAHHHLALQFKQHSVERRYVAIACGRLRAKEGRIQTAHARHPTDRKRFTTRVTSGRTAITQYRVIRELHASSLMEAELFTGRTHQVRVHFAEAGHPLLGDPVYGRAPADSRLRAAGETLGRQALHATLLAFEHPLTHQRMPFSTPVPADMQQAIEALS